MGRASGNQRRGVRVIVCGGRDFKDGPMLSHVLWHVHSKRTIAELIHGGQRGADQMANRWAFEHGIHRTEIRAEWRRYGQTKAPLIRNRTMLDLQPDGLIAFPGGQDARNMVLQAKGRGVPVMDAARWWERHLTERGNVAPVHRQCVSACPDATPPDFLARA